MYFSGFYHLKPVADRAYLAQDGLCEVRCTAGFRATIGRMEVAVVGRNLTNRITAVYALAMPGAAGTFFKLPEAPRSFAVQVSGEF